MKQIPLLQGNVLLIELPNRPRYITLDDQGSRICYYTDKWDWVWQPTPRKSWRIIGMLSELTEEQATELVEKGSDNWGNEFGYHDYLGMFHNVRTALESLESAIEAVGYYLDNNPIPPFHERKDDWMMAQERALDRSRCLLLGRED